MSAYIFFILLLSLLVGLAFRRDLRYEKLVNEKEAVYEPGSGRTTAGYASPGVIVPIFLTYLVLYPLLSGLSDWQSGFIRVGAIAMQLMVVLVGYYPLLLLALPLLRRVVSARCCAVLGTLPTFLFVGNVLVNLPYYRLPPVVLRLPKGLLPTLVWVWLAGGAAVLVWKTAGHLLFRRRLLSDIRPVTDKDALELWDYEQQRIERKKDQLIPLVISPQVTSPLTIGLFSSTLVTVLPDRPYTQEELELIFRHELRHVQRLDSGTKLFYTFCLAFAWFYPPMWLVYHNATADLELSCDEMVLDRADGGRREQYARLLLSQAGDDRGFSTCLSGSAKALEHRLKSVLHPKKRPAGTLLVVVTMVFLLLLGTSVAVSGTYGTVREVVLDKLPPARFTALTAGEWQEEAVMEVLEDLEVTRLPGQGSLPDESERTAYFDFDCQFDDEKASLTLCFTEDGYLSVRCYRFPRSSWDLRGLYRVEEPVDWDALRRQ